MSFRLRLHDKQVIKLEEFYACFREQVVEDVMPAWMDPVNRGPAERASMTATQVHAQLKEKARQRCVYLQRLRQFDNIPNISLQIPSI